MDQGGLLRRMNAAIERAHKACTLSEIQQHLAQELCVDAEQALRRSGQRLEAARSRFERVRHKPDAASATEL